VEPSKPVCEVRIKIEPLQPELTATHLAVRQAGALAQRAADYEGSMTQALITVAQQKALATLL
jgi:hypothetical protein